MKQIKFVSSRPSYGQSATVCVPKLEFQALWSTLVKPGSSIVAFLTKDGAGKICYFEGNLYGASNLRTFKERASCAYGRMATSYPTTALCGDQIDSLDAIGMITSKSFEIDETEAYLSWVALDTTLQLENG